jgi:hypothetical protein
MSNVDHPDHYQSDRYECIDVIESLGLGSGFSIGSAIKYLWRAGRKGDAVEDLEKARWYLDREIARRKSCTKSQSTPGS